MTKAETLFDRAAAFIDGGQKGQAIMTLGRLLMEEPKNERAWLWLEQLVDDPQQKMDCLERVLRINPKNNYANLAMKRLLEKQEQQLWNRRVYRETLGKMADDVPPSPTVRRTEPMHETNGIESTQATSRNWQKQESRVERKSNIQGVEKPLPLADVLSAAGREAEFTQGGQGPENLTQLTQPRPAEGNPIVLPDVIVSEPASIKAAGVVGKPNKTKKPKRKRVAKQEAKSAVKKAAKRGIL